MSSTFGKYTLIPLTSDDFTWHCGKLSLAVDHALLEFSRVFFSVGQ